MRSFARYFFCAIVFIGSMTSIDASALQIQQPQTFALWEGGAPDALGTEADDMPTLTVFQPATGTSTGTAVVICPGGGYGHLAMDHEGYDVARWLNELGITAFVLKYRHAPDYKHPTPLRDAQRAIRLVRSQASTWGIQADQVG
ncbi:MAG: alpha/beta hydrolase, partial [Rhodothermales bacterium]